MKSRSMVIALLCALAGIAIGIGLGPVIRGRALQGQTPSSEHADEHADHAGHEGEEGPIQLSEEARRIAGIKVDTVRKVSMPAFVDVPGTLETNPSRTVRITATAPGRITRLMARLGSPVKAGQTLAVLDSAELAKAHADVDAAEADVRKSEAATQEALADIEQAKAGVKVSETELEHARVRLNSAETALTRQKELADAGAFSQAPLQAAQAELIEARTERQRAESEAQAHALALKRAERLFREELISRGELEQAQLEVRHDDAQLERARGREVLAEKAVAREKRVSEANLLNRQAVQAAEADRREAQAEVRTAESSLARASQDVHRSQRAYDAARTANRGAIAALAAARSTLAALEGDAHVPGTGGLLAIRSPIAGVITGVQVTLGEAVGNASTLFVVENMKTLLAVGNVPEAMIGPVRIGQKVRIAVPALPARSFTGVVQSIAGSLDPKTRSLAVRAVVENPDGVLRAEMFANLQIITGDAGARLSVPNSAVITTGDTSYVFVEEGTDFVRREIRTGRTSADHTEALSGLKEGDRIAVAGVFVLRSELQKSELKGHEH